MKSHNSYLCKNVLFVVLPLEIESATFVTDDVAQTVWQMTVLDAKNVSSQKEGLVGKES